MKLAPIAALALFAAAATPTFAAEFTLDFEKNWAYGSDVNGYYAGGTADDGSSGTNLGVSFVGVAGLSNDADFTYYSGAPSAQGVAYAHTFAPGDRAFMNVAAGVDGALSFFYASPDAVNGAVQAWSGLNGTGVLLGSFDLAANDAGAYASWSQAMFSFSGTAHSFEFTQAANVVAFDNISAVPEPASVALMLAGVTVLVARRRRV